jgi:hypothetical protein
MPEAILDRFHIIHFGEFTYEDMINVVIPQQYKELREELGESSLPEMLQPEDIALIYKICSGKARNIKMALQQILTKLYGANGNRKASVSEEDLIYMSAAGVSSQKRKIGF